MLCCLKLFLAITIVAVAPVFADRNKPINWSHCYQDLFESIEYECALVPVPLDWEVPNGTKIYLSLLRRPARDADVRGTLFLNPGGPGGSGVDFALFFGAFGDQIIFDPTGAGSMINKYHIVGFDPRGIAGSTTLQCFDNEKQALEALYVPFPYPDKLDEVVFFEESNEALDSACQRRASRVLNHMSTANVVRDLEYLRILVGDEKLNFYGLSYGTLIGQMYATMFPTTTGAMILDGNLDAKAWVNRECEEFVAMRLRSDQGAQATLEEFFRQCDASAYCTFGPDSEQRFFDLYDTLRELGLPGLDHRTLAGEMLGGMYNPFSWFNLSRLLRLLEDQVNIFQAEVDVLTLLEMMDDVADEFGFVNKVGLEYDNVVEGFPCVMCSDSCTPDVTYEDWFYAAEDAEEEYGIFAKLWAAQNTYCLSWTAEDTGAFAERFGSNTATPILVLGNLYDPATRYEGSITTYELFPNSILVTVDVPGHCALDLNLCAMFAINAYLDKPDDPSVSELHGSVCQDSFGNFIDVVGNFIHGGSRHLEREGQEIELAMLMRKELNKIGGLY